MSDGGQWGSDAPGGPGWWQASDGKWYPPQEAPPPPATGPPPAGAGLAASTGAVALDFDGPLEIDRWRPLVAWLLAIPHYFVLLVLGIGAVFVAIAAFFAVLFTKRVPPGMHTYLVRVHRYAQRVMAYTYWMTPEYPSFGLAGDDRDPGGYPMRLSIDHADELQRFGPLYKWILAIPHFVVLYALQLAMNIVLFISFFVVLFTGSWNAGMRDFVIKVMRWQLRVTSYLLLRDEYPPFTFD